MYNLSAIMTAAWNLVKTANKTMSEALKASWQAAKGVFAKPEGTTEFFHSKETEKAFQFDVELDLFGGGVGFSFGWVPKSMTVTVAGRTFAPSWFIRKKLNEVAAMRNASSASLLIERA